MKRLAGAVLTLFLTPMAMAQTDDPLHELDYFVGSWIWEGQINLHSEAPEEFRWRNDCERTLDGRFILERQRDLSEGLKMVHISLIGWDDKAEKIRAWGFWAPPSGPHEEVVFTKTNDGWHITREGLDGRVTIIDKNTCKYEADFERDGATNHWGFTARRLKSPTEADARKAIDTLVGKWAITFEEDGEKKSATVTATPSSSEMALRVTFHEPGKQPANGMFAWHATKNQVVETWFRGGEHVRICFDGMTDDGALIGAGEGMLEDVRFAGLRILKFHSPDHYTHSIRGCTSEGEPLPDVTFVGKRIVSKPIE
jgi:hypothetical protein